MKRIDLKGKRFGRLIALSYTSKVCSDRKRVFWLCQCDCGQIKKIEGEALLRGLTQSCGCLKKELIRERSLKHGATINRKPSKEYRAWTSAKNRCYNSDNPKYPNYGKRGIVMCKKWKDDFSTFFKDMGKCPIGYSLDRKNVHGNYDPKNCHWTTNKTQARHRTDNVYITYKRKTMIQADWARELNIDNRLFHSWLKKGYSMAKIVRRIKK